MTFTSILETIIVMLRKRKKIVSIKKGHWRKLAPFTVLFSAIILGAIFLPTNLLNQKKAPPKIDSITPSVITVGKEFTVTGSGFTTEEEFKGSSRTGGVLIGYSGNWYQIKGSLQGPPAFSPDGKTLKFPTLNIDSRQIPQNCQTETTGKRCQVPFHVVNGSGVVSNVKQIEIFIPEYKPLIFSSAYALDSPTNQNIPAGAKDVEVLRIQVRADAQNDFDILVSSLSVSALSPSGPIDCDSTWGYFRAYEFESGRDLGIGGMYQSWANPAGCMSMFPLLPAIVLPPGTEKTILVKMTLEPQAQVGLQFGLGATPDPEGYIYWVDYPLPQGSGNTITIVAP